MTIRNKPKHQYNPIQRPYWFQVSRPCVLTIHDHIPCQWNGDGQSRQCLSHPCRLSLSEQPVDTLPLTLIPSSLFFFFFSSREQFVSTLNHFLPVSSLLLLYSFFGHTVYRQSTHSRHFAFSLFRFTRPYSHSGSDILSFIYKYSFFRFHQTPYDYFDAPVIFKCPKGKPHLHSTLTFLRQFAPNIQ